MNLQVQALSELKLNEIEVIDLVCLQLEKDLNFKLSFQRPLAILFLHEKLFEPLNSHLLNMEPSQLQRIAYQVDLNEKESQKAQMEPKLERLTELILNRCFQKVYLRNLLKD